MKLKDALEIVLGLAKDNALDVHHDDDVGEEDSPATIEAANVQQEALEMIEAWWKGLS